ncbi:hypothetical protein C7M61_003889 [Candidozyma pseudohaemuli]|uniref:Chaperone DnaJ n=1 Tax=Candidozyma pseudohaemuli TaxID=418784 RepID=A0A2P7YKC9_9ASCO|nr:hypothetical protein C7M61_003889 [[Candida] pseudohaemulonii]PSK36419.1 hypothetical protein C7M61_003889 [[Candida] pseudohaemulonii]
MILLVFLFVCLAFVAAIDPYSVLGVPKDADEKTIKTAYRQLSKQYHPDKNLSPEAHDKFIEIGEAYDILNDPQKKQNYDQFGDANGGGGFGGGGAGFDFGDMFNQFFQGQGGFHGGHGHQRRVQKGPDTQVNVEMTLKDAFLGKDLEFDVEMNNICSKCKGSRSADGKKHTCTKCDGRGVVMMRRQMGPIIQQFQSQCDQCGGKGQTIAKPCKKCEGQGTERVSRHYNVYVSPGTPRNHRHVLEGEGDQNPDFVAGNMNLQFRDASAENWGFRRIKNHLYRTELLTSKEANAGDWSRNIAFFDGESVTVKRGKNVPVIDGEVEVIKGHGMPHFNDEHEYGDLFVEYKVIPVGRSSTKDEL